MLVPFFFKFCSMGWGTAATRDRFPRGALLFQCTLNIRKNNYITKLTIKIKTIDRIIRHLELTFEAERPPPPHHVQQDLLMAAEEGGDYF